MKNHEMEFELWFKIYSSTLKKLGHIGPIDAASARFMFDEDEYGDTWPEEAALIKCGYTDLVNVE